MRNHPRVELVALAAIAAELANLSRRPVVGVSRVLPEDGDELAGDELERARVARLRARAHYRLDSDVAGEEDL